MLTSKIALWTYALFAFLPVVVSALKISAFNIQVFGTSKMSKPDVVEILVKILRRYDITLIQEIRDSSETAIYELLEDVNNAGDEKYEMVISERLGRTSSKEQYAYFFRSDRGIRVLGTYQDPDAEDLFQREPYNVYFAADTTAIKRFSLSGLHADPDEAAEEIAALEQVIGDVKVHFEDENVMVLGDLNADCNYFNSKDKEESPLRAPDYYWLIDDEADTTVSATDCAYDRFITDSADLMSHIVKDSVKVFQFQEEYDLSEELAKDVSDHYPIEFELIETVTEEVLNEEESENSHQEL